MAAAAGISGDQTCRIVRREERDESQPLPRARLPTLRVISAPSRRCDIKVRAHSEAPLGGSSIQRYLVKY